jgi:hypothetical protein
VADVAAVCDGRYEPKQGSQTQAVGTQNQGFVTSFGGLRVVLDPNIGTTYGAGTNEDDIDIVRSSDLIRMESELRQVAFDQVLSSTLTIRLQVFAYSAFVPGRYPSTITIVSDTGLATPSW